MSAGIREVAGSLPNVLRSATYMARVRVVQPNRWPSSAILASTEERGDIEGGDTESGDMDGGDV